MASEYLKWKYRDVQPDAPRELTAQERRANWWHYHKWHVGAAVLLALVLGDLGLNAWKTHRDAPDYQAAYVAAKPLPEEAVSALETVLSGLTGGGKVRVNQYLTAQTGDADLYASAANIQLMADLETCESFLF